MSVQQLTNYLFILFSKYKLVLAQKTTPVLQYSVVKKEYTEVQPLEILRDTNTFKTRRLTTPKCRTGSGNL